METRVGRKFWKERFESLGSACKTPGRAGSRAWVEGRPPWREPGELGGGGADDDGGVEGGVGGGAAEHGGGGALAVGAGDGDAGGAEHGAAQGVGVEVDGDAAPGRLLDLGVVGACRGGGDDEVAG